MRRRIQSFDQYIKTRKGPPIVCDGWSSWWDGQKWHVYTFAEWKKHAEKEMAKHDRRILGQAEPASSLNLEDILPNIRIEES